MKQILVILLYLSFVSICFAGEVTVKSSYSIPEGSLVEIKEYRYSNYYCIKLRYDKFDNGTIYEYEVLRVYDDDTVGYMQPIYYKNTEVKVFDYLVLQGFIYNPFTGDVSPVTENEPDVTDNDSDDLDNVVTTEKVVYLNRIELYLLWLLCIQAISCGVLLFLCFKGFEKV
jgi:hypothetical protein